MTLLERQHLINTQEDAFTTLFVEGHELLRYRTYVGDELFDDFNATFYQREK